MSDINLLPEELREKEKREKERAKKEKPEIKMIVPRVESIKKEKEPKTPSSWWKFLKSLFSAASVPKKSVPPKEKLELAPPLKIIKEKKPEIKKDRLEPVVEPKIPSISKTPQKKGLSWWEKLLATSPGDKEKKIKENILKRKMKEEKEKNKREKALIKAQEKKSREEFKRVRREQEKLKKKASQKLYEIKTLETKVKNSFPEELVKEKKKVKIKEGRHLIYPAEKVKRRFIGVNLIPEELLMSSAKSQSSWLNVLEAVTLVFIIIVIGLYLGASWYQIKISPQLREINARMEVVNSEISFWQGKKGGIMVLEQQLDVVIELLNKHVYLTKVLENLEKYTLDDIYYTNFSIESGDEIVLRAVAKDYQTAARQLDIFNRTPEFIKKANSHSAALHETEKENKGVGLDINISLAEGLFN